MHNFLTLFATFNSKFIFNFLGGSNYKDENLKQIRIINARSAPSYTCIILLNVQSCIWSFQSYILQSVWILTHSLSLGFSLSSFRLHPYHWHTTDIPILSKNYKWISKRSIWNAFQMFAPFKNINKLTFLT